jgi:TonB-dependent heme/hemoglobin receptor
MHVTVLTGRARGRTLARAAWLFAILLPALARPVLAAEPQTRSAFADTTRPVMFLKETVVTGARYSRMVYESPQALSFLPRQTLRELQPVVLGDVLATLPGVDSNKDSPWEQRPSIRGLTGQRVLVLVDGSPMNSVRGNGPHTSLVDPSQVERIEVVRGPSSVAYGSDALGGVINIITRESDLVAGSQGFRGTATVGGSLEGLPERNGSLVLMARHERFSAFLSGGGRKADDFKNADGTVPQSGLEAWNGLANLRYDLTERLTLKGAFQLYRGQGIGIPGLDVTAPGYSQSFRFKKYSRDFAHLTLEHRYPSSSWLESGRINTYWQREYRNFYSDIAIDIPMGPPPPGRLTLATDRFLDMNTVGVQAQMTTQKTRTFRFSGGLDAGRDFTGGTNSELQSIFDGAGNPLAPSARVISASVPDGRFDSYAAYLQGEFFLAPQWTLDLGGRYTRYRYRTEFGLNGHDAGGAPVYFEPKKLDHDALSGSVGVVYSPLPDLHLTANVANGYREPNAQDLFFSGPGSVGFVVGNPDLKPERSVSYDAGVRWGPGDFAFSGNVFLSSFDDLIDAVPADTPSPQASPGQPTYQYVNITKARMSGGDVEVQWQFHPQWSARTAMATTVGNVTSREAIRELYGLDADHVPLDLVPPFGGSTSLRWTEPARRVWVQAGTRYSTRYDRLPPPIPGVGQLSTPKSKWMVGDVATGLSLTTGQRLVVGVRNVLDQRYRQPIASVVDPGRTFYASLSSDF